MSARARSGQSGTPSARDGKERGKERQASRTTRVPALQRQSRQQTQFRRMRGLQADMTFAIVAHELRAPVSGIAAHAWALEQYWDRLTTEERLDSVRSIRHRSRYLEHLISDLLTVTRAEAGNPISVSLRPVDLGPIIRALAVELTIEQPIEVRVDIPDEVPPTLTDSNRAQQVLTNLIHNAVKFSPPGAAVRVWQESNENEVIVHVQDLGPGIRQKDLNRLFRPFVRLNDGRPGSGIGLYVTKLLMEALKGRVWAESVEGHGSTFSCAFPRWRSDTHTLDAA